MKPILVDDILMGREKASPFTDELTQNLSDLLMRLNKLQDLYKQQFRVTSGYRPPALNRTIGGAPKSSHMTCQAADIADPDSALADWLMRAPEVLIKLGLYMEHPDYTQGWCHLQTRPTRKRVFIPYPRKV